MQTEVGFRNFPLWTLRICESLQAVSLNFVTLLLVKISVCSLVVDVVSHNNQRMLQIRSKIISLSDNYPKDGESRVARGLCSFHGYFSLCDF